MLSINRTTQEANNLPAKCVDSKFFPNKGGAGASGSGSGSGASPTQSGGAKPSGGSDSNDKEGSDSNGNDKEGSDSNDNSQSGDNKKPEENKPNAAGKVGFSLFAALAAFIAL